MHRYLIPLILTISALFFWLNKDPEVITRYSRIFFCSFIAAPGIMAFFLFKYNKWLAGLLLWLGITTTINLFGGYITFNVASREMLFFISLALMFYYIQIVNVDNKLIIKTMWYLITFMAGLGIFQSLTGIYFPFEKIEKSMAVGLLDNIPNLATFLAIGLPFAFPLIGFFILPFIMFLGNFTALLACLTGINFLYKSKYLIIISIFAVIIFVGMFKMQTILNFSTSSIVDRGRIWYESLKITKPMVGWGLGNYKVKMPKYMQKNDIKNMGRQIYDNPSNDYVRAVFEAGFPVLIFLFGFIYSMLKKGFVFSRVYFASFVSILVLCMGYSLFINPTNIIWATIIIALFNKEVIKGCRKEMV